MPRGVPGVFEVFELEVGGATDQLVELKFLLALHEHYCFEVAIDFQSLRQI
jgi:hypothetical protein